MAIRNQFDKVKFKGQKFNKIVKTHGYFYDNAVAKTVFGLHGTKDIYSDIQSVSNDTDIDFIKKSLLDNAPSALDESLFANVSDISSDMLENFSRIQIARDNFYALPAEVRALHNNDFNEFARKFKKEDLLKTSYARFVKSSNIPDELPISSDIQKDIVPTEVK